MEFHNKVRWLYPWPIAKAYEAYRLETDVRNQVAKLVALTERTTKYLACLAISLCIHFELESDKVTTSRQGLTTPSFGNWASLYKECFTVLKQEAPDFLELGALEYYADGHPIRECTKLLRDEINSGTKTKKYSQFTLIDSIVEFRNSKIGHGDIDARVAQTVHKLLLEGIVEWIGNLQVLENFRLVYVERIEFELPEFVYVGMDLNNGTSLEVFSSRGIQKIHNNQTYLYNETQKLFVTVHPFIVYDNISQLTYLYDKIISENQIALQLPCAIPSAGTDRHFLSVNSTCILGLQSQILKSSSHSEHTTSEELPGGNPAKADANEAMPSEHTVNIPHQDQNDTPLGEELLIERTLKGENHKAGRKWLVPEWVEPSLELRAAVGGHPLVAQLLAQRGFDTPQKALPFLHIDQYTPSHPSALVGLERAAALLYDAIKQGQKILVWGDFDVDGQTSTSLLVAALRDIGRDEQVRFHVPNRFSESHGIRASMLRQYLDDPGFCPQVLLTCDTGIAEAEGIGIAKDRGLTVIITDHHDLPAEFAGCELGVDPPCGEVTSQVGQASVRRADAIVNPKFQKLDDPLRTLPGVGVAYKLVQRLYELADRGGEAVQFLDLVALGIVADVAEQVHDARYLLQLGLDKLRRTERIGLKALMHNGRINPAVLNAEDIGFQLGPRMNALGRLEDATVAVELLTTRDAIRAGELAARMERLNNQRRLLTSQIASTAFEILDRNPHYLDFNAIVLAHPQWHAGIVGIVASRIVEEFSKPAILLLNPPGEPARGSARSIPGVDIGASIAACSDLLLGHGGHPGAAGLSLPAENIDHFRRELSRQIEHHRIDAGPSGLRIDAEVPFGDLDLPLVEQIERLGPFGNGNPKPVFMSRRLTVADDRRIGKDGTHRKLLLVDGNGSKQPVIWFRGADVDLPEGAIDFAYSLSVNEYRGERSLQLGYVDSRPAQRESIEVVESKPARLPIHDLRQEMVQPADLPADAVWLAEGTAVGDVAFHSRLDVLGMPRHGPLVLWSVPPSQELLSWLMETVMPSAVYLVGQATTDDTLGGVLKSVAGMAKYALSRDCRLPIDRLAARIGTTEAVIRHSLRWLEVKKLIQLEEWEGGDVVRIAAGDGATLDATERQILEAELSEQLAEVRAYRRFFKRARPSELRIA